jgi:hypothetical protein
MPYKDPKKQKEAKRRYYLKNKYGITDPPKFPPIKIPNSIKETQYPGYYIGDDGKAYRVPGIYDRNSEINEYGLIPLNMFLRGNRLGKKYQYFSINITLRDETGKFLHQKRAYIHRLVAEAFIPNPYNLSDVDHIDRNKHNNSIDNLRWVSREENMSWNAKPFYITDTKTGKVYEGENNIKWIKENWDWISLRTKMKQVDFIKLLNYRKKANGFILQKLEKE